HADAEYTARCADRPGANPDQHARSAGPHQVQPRVIRGATADHDWRWRELADEFLEVQRRAGLVARNALGRDNRALDDQDVEASFQRHFVVPADLLRGERGGRDDAVRLDLLDP